MGLVGVLALASRTLHREERCWDIGVIGRLGAYTLMIGFLCNDVVEILLLRLWEELLLGLLHRLLAIVEEVPIG